MMMTSDQWAKQPQFARTTILDPDGWDRRNYQFSFFQELITEDEFGRRLMISTCLRRAA
jgi:hypothetical protein